MCKVALQSEVLGPHQLVQSSQIPIPVSLEEPQTTRTEAGKHWPFFLLCLRFHSAQSHQWLWSLDLSLFWIYL
jgi:hypothetical protein